MNDHVIRVFVRGFDQLSGVMRQMADRTGPALSGMVERFRRVRNESNQTNASLARTGANIDALGNKLDKQRTSVERFTNSWLKLKTAMQRRLGREQLEDPDDMFTRLRREGNAPRVRRQAGGLPMFQSRENFVNQEKKRRAMAAQAAELERQNTLLGKLETKRREITSKFEGHSPIDDLIRGWKQFTASALEGQDTVLEQQIKNQQALSDFDEKVNEARAKKIKDNESDRRDAERIVGIRESNVRKGLAQLDKELDKFVIDENLKLKQKRIDVRVELGPSDEDRRIAANNSKKNAAAREEARIRIAEAQKAVNQAIALEEAASQQRIANRRHETREINRESLAGIKEGEREVLAAETAASRRRLQIFDAEKKEERLKLRESQRAQIADLPELIRKRNSTESEAIKNLKVGDREATPIEKLGARASRGLKDFFRGFTGAREQFKEFEGDARKVQTVAAQVGARFGDAARDVNKLVNVRWGLLLSLIGVLGTVVTQLAGALVAVASSAVLAAAALGGALVTGVLAAIPVVGLLAAAFHELQDAMKVVELRDQARTKSPDDAKARSDAQRRAAEGLADAQHGLKAAHEGVTEAELGLVRAHESVKDANYDLAASIRGIADAQRNLRAAHEAVSDAEIEQRDAVKGLADARRDARRGIVDASLDEADARLSVREAELGVLDAKQKLADFEKSQRKNNVDLGEAQAAVKEAQDRLAAARAQGDAVEIATASAALAAARGDVSAVQTTISKTKNQQKELEEGVERAKLTERQAKIREQRSIADNARIKREGVEGSPAVRSAVERVTHANRGYRDAVQGVRDAIQRVSDAERAVTLSRRGVRDAIQGVVAANHNLRDSHYQVAHAQRSVKDAILAVNDAAAKLDATQKNAQRAFNKLSPGQQDFVLAMEEFKKTYTKYIAPITDTIVSAFSRGLKRAGILMKDPEIRGNLQTLADQIARVGDNFTKWAISPEGRRAINFFIQEASKNLPKIAKAAGDLAQAFLNIGQAAAPVFDKIVSGIESISKKFKDATALSKKIDPEELFHHREQQTGPSRVEKFFATSGKHLTAWGKLTAAVGNFFKALVTAAAPEGLKMVQGMTRFFNRMADAIDRNPKKVQGFFKNVREGLQELLPTLGKFALTLLKVFTSKEMIAFTQFMLLTVIPAVLHVIQAIGLLIRFFGFLVNGIDGLLTIPLISTIGKWVIGLGIFFGILTKIFPITRLLIPIFVGLGKALFFVGRAMAGFLIANPWVALILAIIAVVIILDRHFHFLRPTILALKRAFEFVWNWIKDHWKLLLAMLTGPFGLAVAAIIEHRDKIWNSIKAVYNWIRDNWRKVLGWLISPFKSALEHINKWRKDVGDAIRGAYHEIVDQFRKLPGRLSEFFKKIPGLLKDALKGLGGIVSSALSKIPVIGKFFGGGESKEEAESKLFAKVRGSLPRKARGAAGQIFADKKDLSDTIQELVDRKLITQKQRLDLAEKFGASLLFDKGGEVGNNIREGRAVPIIAHAGEWVLNKSQQYKLAARLGASVDQISMMLFGTGRSPTGKQSGKPYVYPNGFELIPHEDDYGKRLWFLKMRDGQYVQVTEPAADKIIASGGHWFPGFVNRHHGGAFVKAFNARATLGFKDGGVVSFAPPGVQSFETGGVVGGQVITRPSRGGNTVNQEFNVKTEGDSDWNHILELGAQKAQGSY